MTDSPIQRTQALIAEARALESLSPAERTAGKILLHGRLVAMQQELLDYHLGQTEEYRTLVGLVGQMLASIAAPPSNGSPPWWEEIPPRTGSAFRMSVRRLVEWLKGNS